MKASPAAAVKKSFGTRKDLVAKLVPLVDDLTGQGPEKLRSRLATLPNKKLLRLYLVEQKVRERFGDRAKLVESLIASRKKAGLSADAAFSEKLAGFSKARLLDMSREQHRERPTKQTPAQKLASKNGRKERERALRKAGKSS